MVLHGLLGGTGITLSLKPGSFVVGADDEYIVAWDRAGRLYSVVEGERTYRRGLNGAVLEKSRSGGRLLRRRLNDETCSMVLDDAAGLAGRVLDAGRGGLLRWGEPLAPDLATELDTALARASRFDARAAAADAKRFAAVYEPVGILPPDQYLSVVLQATEGCLFNTCTFCSLYQRPYRVRTPGEFRAHVRAVREYLGESLLLRGRAIFLGAANALAVPTARLLAIFDEVNRAFGPSAHRIAAFVDGFTGARKTDDEYRALASRGLTRVYIGLETGHDPLLTFVQKPATAAQALDTARTLKAAGIALGVIVMLGIGGTTFADAHARDTAEVLSAMSLGLGDIVYFSALAEEPGAPYPRHATDAGIRPLDEAAIGAQREAICRRVSFPDDPPQFATYDIREFVY